MTKKSYRIVLHKEQLTFSAAHFITFGDNICERLHGHNYAVRCEVYGGLNGHGYVVDFIALRDQLASITQDLDHHVLLPNKHPTIRIETSHDEVTATFAQRRWIFPLDDCRLLPIENTTAELIAGYIVDRLVSATADWATPDIDRILIGVDENQGQWGECELNLKS